MTYPDYVTDPSLISPCEVACTQAIESYLEQRDIDLQFHTVQCTTMRSDKQYQQDHGHPPFAFTISPAITNRGWFENSECGVAAKKHITALANAFGCVVEIEYPETLTACCYVIRVRMNVKHWEMWYRYDEEDRGVRSQWDVTHKADDTSPEDEDAAFYQERTDNMIWGRPGIGN
jgi:hypothetical protein